ncbi:MAG: sigma-70 family RNA polymerase sigma factor [Microbacteriaceae bacterium]|nr:sigma-70 family RNA polymerase sigma factor [Burkholderiaceae bacterium]
MKTPQDLWTERSRELAAALSRSVLGDRTAFKRVYDLSSSHLFAVILRIQRDRDLADELLQEVYVSAWKAAASFDASRAQPMTWLTHIARNKAIDSLRRAQTQPRTESLQAGGDDDDRPDAQARLVDESPGPAALLERASDARQLGHCMEGLSAPQRQSVALAFFDGLSHAEVADQLCQPLGTVKSWVRRALMTLKSCLEKAAQTDRAMEA